MANQFSERDKEIMKVAIEEAKIAFQTGNWPVGAVLVVDNKIVAKERNHKGTKRDRISHAEMLLFMKYSQDIYQWNTVENKTVELFTTCEPCLMCWGTAVIHRLDRVVVACRDPRGNMRSIKPELIGDYYIRNWPSLEFGLCFDESYDLLNRFYAGRDDPESREAADLFARMRDEN